MARYLGPKCKLSRREGTDLFLKSRARPIETKCQIDKTPGMGSTRPGRMSDYALQLREKQKLRRIYGVLERQFRKYYKEAARQKGSTGENLLQILECRLDNVVYRMGFASTRPAARQMVNHGHFLVNNRKVNIASFSVKAGDVIQVRDRSKKMDAILDSMKRIKGDLDLPWLELDKAKMTGNVIAIPEREDMQVLVNEQLVVELYSK